MYSLIAEKLLERPPFSKVVQPSIDLVIDQFQYSRLFSRVFESLFKISFMTTLTEINFFFPGSLDLDLRTLLLLAVACGCLYT